MAYGNISAIGKCTLGTNVTMTNNVALMDDNNIIMLCDDMVLTGTHAATDALLTLPDSSMFPLQRIPLLVCFLATNGSSITTKVLYVQTDGTITCNLPAAGTYYLNGYLWHNNGRYYSSNIGNIGGFSSPLGAR